jgi:hypothetical protein
MSFLLKAGLSWSTSGRTTHFTQATLALPPGREHLQFFPKEGLSFTLLTNLFAPQKQTNVPEMEGQK